MSDSSDDNLSDLEQENGIEARSGSGDDEEKVELKGILDDVEETAVSWKDLVSSNFFCSWSTCLMKFLSVGSH